MTIHSRLSTSLRLASVAIVSLALFGCSHMAPRYGMSASNIETIRQAAGTSPQKVSVGEFTAWTPNVSSSMCRAAGAVSTPDHETFATYIQRALIDELKVAGVYAADSPIRIDGRLDHIDFNSNIGSGKWQIDLTVAGVKSGPVVLHETYEFSTNFVADRACDQVAAALQPSVQNLLGKLYATEGFKSTVSSSK
jgi:hypothetical protein